MPRPINPIYNSIIYYAMMIAMDRIGINPALFARQTAYAISPIMKRVAGTLGLKLPENLNEFGELQKQFDDMDSIPDQERTEFSFNDGMITLKIHNCGFLEVSDYAEGVGYNRCPVCLLGAVNIGLLKALNLSETKDFTVQKDGAICTIRITPA
jgi:hypothetical protein